METWWIPAGFMQRKSTRISCRPHEASRRIGDDVGALDGKAIAITGAGRGIGRAVAMACAAEGAAVVVNDYGVSVDGSEPTSEVADEVVAEIRAAGGKAAANAQSVTTMEGGASIVNQAVDEFG